VDRSQLITELRAIPARERIITALDVPDHEAARALADDLGDQGRFVKVGLELFSAAGPRIVTDLRQAGKEVFLDLKYHDIPNTVAAAARVAAALGATMTTVHASAGRRALSAAAAALAEAPAGPDGRRPALLAVTILTSLSAEELQEIGPSPDSLQERIDRLAHLAWECGCDGLVCSAADLPRLRESIGPEALVVTPGIRPAGGEANDQRRVTTPRQALAAGADFLVVGRPITRAEDPAAALDLLAAELVD